MSANLSESFLLPNLRYQNMNGIMLHKLSRSCFLPTIVYENPKLAKHCQKKAKSRFKTFLRYDSVAKKGCPAASGSHLEMLQICAL